MAEWETAGPRGRGEGVERTQSERGGRCRVVRTADRVAGLQGDGGDGPGMLAADLRD